MIASPAVGEGVAENLLEYFHCRLGIRGVRFVQTPTQIPDGWETYIYRFQLQKSHDLPAEFSGPLVLRIYSSFHGLSRLQHEFLGQSSMAEIGYPVAKPLICEEDCDLFGGPFMIMQAVPGRTLLDLLLNRPWTIWSGAREMAEMHARLHRIPLPLTPTPLRVAQAASLCHRERVAQAASLCHGERGRCEGAAPGPFLARRLREMASEIEEYGLDGLRPGLSWLEDHRPDERDAPCVIHLDFHPVNLMFGAHGCQDVLDWSEWDIGDRHADIATTIVLIKSAPVEVPNVLQRLMTRPGRFWLVRWYLRRYRQLLPLDEQTLAYYVAWASFRRLCRWGVWLKAGPPITGSKPSSMRYLNSHRVGILRRYFQNSSGVAVALDGR